jgi:type IV pilus assembly protein PilB
MVSESKVTQILSQQLSVPWVSLEYIDFSRQLLNLVSTEIAQKYTLVPIYVRRSKNRSETLYVAMEDPSDSVPLEEISQYSGLPVRPMIAPPSDIRAAIRAYYLGLPPEAPPDMHSQPPSGSIPPPGSIRPSSPMTPVPFSLESSEALSMPPSAPDFQVDEEVPESSEPVPSREPTIPEPKAQGESAIPMITLTMLDGTQMKLPASRGRGQVAAEGELTARDLIEALRAEADGSDLSDVFGENVNWQRMFAALLSLLLKKHLVHDWEFVRELRK